jgi:uncharacterized membrane protein YkvA (DUF1232 family)
MASPYHGGGIHDMGLGERWRQQARRLKQEVFALYLACRDPRVPWYAKALAAIVVAYALSPVDLIPDFIPVLGYLDDLILIPLGVLAVRAMIGADVMDECRRRAREVLGERKPTSRVGLALVVGVWILLAGVALWLAVRWLSR